MNPFRWTCHFLALDVLFGSRNGAQPCEVDTTLLVNEAMSDAQIDELNARDDRIALDSIANELDLFTIDAPTPSGDVREMLRKIGDLVSETGRTVRTPEATGSIVEALLSLHTPEATRITIVDAAERQPDGSMRLYPTQTLDQVQQALDRAFITRKRRITCSACMCGEHASCSDNCDCPCGK